ncbi:MAG TPA: hypothetical protein VN656_15735, partial [Stellaceae bacterium]|nr:hypothetical protein [Stellaceae bacterium]
MIARRLLCWIAFLALLSAPLLSASAESAAAQAAPGTPTVAQLQQLVSTLKDDKARERLIGELQALIAAQNAQQQQGGSPFAWVSQLPDQIDAIGSEILAAVPVLLQMPRAAHWVERQFGDPALRDYWGAVFEKVITFLGAGIVAGLLVWLLSRGAALRLTRATRDHWAARLLLLTLGAVVEALPAVAFAATVAFVTPLTDPNTGTRGVAVVIATAAVWAWGLVAMARVLLLAPAAQTLYALGDETCNYLYIWIRRFAYTAAIGYAASTGAWWLGAPSAIVGLLIRVS